MKRKIVLIWIFLLGYIFTQDTIKEPASKLEDKLKAEKDRIKQNGHKKVLVHVVPHSHDDLGWTRTIDDYWFERVLNIYNELPKTMMRNPKRTFIIDGIDYFMMWWRDQTEETQATIRELVQSGRIEIVNGGWSEHDEGAAYYSDMISNLQFGQLMALKELGVTPKVGWQIDVFGLSASNARMMADSGIKAIFMNRVDVHEREIRRHNLDLEFIWRPYYMFSGKDAQLFGHLFWHHYSVPEFWGIKVHEDLLLSPRPNNETQWDNFTNLMNEYLLEQANHHLSSNLFFTVGDDFFYFRHQEDNFQLIEEIFTRLNNKFPNVTWKFSTPSQYIEAIQTEKKIYPVKYDDFIPFVDDPELGNYWIGYFSSRPNLKSAIRQLSQLNFGGNKIMTMYALKIELFWDSMVSDIILARDILMDAVGMSQHHDTVTGTCRQEVAYDYAFRIHKALHESRLTIAQLIKVQLLQDTGTQAENFLFCERSNGTYLDCPIARNLSANNWLVSAYNPSLKKRNIIRIKLPHPHWQVEIWDHKFRRWDQAYSEAICEPMTLDSMETVINCETYIQIENQPFQYSYARLRFDDAYDISIKPEKKKNLPRVEISNSNVTLRYHNSYDGAYFTLHKKGGGFESFIFDMRYYRSLALERQDETRKGTPSSGMYMFVANMSDNNGDSDRYSEVRNFQVYRGKLIQQITFKMSAKQANYVTAKVQLQRFGQYQALMFWEVDIHGANPREKSNEITVNFMAPNLNCKEVFWTDSNGLKMMRRVLNQRESYQMRTPQRTSSNYFPVSSAISIYDEESNLRMVVMPDRTMGGSSLKSGRIELLAHRRVDGDEQRGVFEHLIEVNPEGRPIHVHSEFAVHLFNKKQEQSLQRSYQTFQHETQQVFFSDRFAYNHTQDYTKVKTKLYNNYFSEPFLKKVGITDNMKLYVMPLDQFLFSLRIENLDDKFDHSKIDLKTAPQVDVRELAWEIFKLSNNDDQMKKYIDQFEMKLTELSLSGNQVVENVKNGRGQWIGSDDDTKTDKNGYLKDIEGTNKITLEQMRLRTFLVELTYKSAAQSN